MMKPGPFIVLVIGVVACFFLFPNNIHALVGIVGLTILMSIENLKMRILGPSYSDNVHYYFAWDEFVKTREYKLAKEQSKENVSVVEQKQGA